MVSIFDKTLPVNKPLVYSLTSLFGISYYNAHKICQYMGINPSIRVYSLKKSQIRQLSKYIRKYFLIEQDLRKQLNLQKQKLITIKTCRGLRNLKGLPVRGQRTHTNRKTIQKQYRKK